MKRKQVYVLMLRGGNPLCVCSTKKELQKATTYWSKEYSNQTLAYEMFEQDYIVEPLEWGWCYIAKCACRKTLKKGNGFVPPKSFWGKNLLDSRYSRGLAEAYNDSQKRFGRYLDHKYGRVDG